MALREYFVSSVASGTSGGRDNIVRGEASFTWRFARLLALTFRLIGNRRDARFTALGATRQTQVTAGLFLHAARAGPLRRGRLAIIARGGPHAADFAGAPP